MAEKDEIKTTGLRDGKIPEYESPIILIEEEIRKKLLKQQEDAIIYQIQQVVDVNKEELIKALNYDRQQYEKGYNDGYEDGKRQAQKTGRWIPIKPLLTATRCSECKSAFAERTNYCPHCGAKMETKI